MRTISMVSMAVGVSLLAGACAPSTKPLGYIGGPMLAAVGAGMIMSASGGGDDTGRPVRDGLRDLGGGLAMVTFGYAAVLTGLVILAGAALSPSGPEVPPPAPSTPLAPLAPSAAGPMAPPPPPRTSTAPSGSPLAFP